MKSFFAYIFLFFASPISYAQALKIDSLKTAVETAADPKQKIAALLELCRVKAEKTGEDIEASVRQGIKLAKEKGSKNDIAKFYRLLGTYAEKTGQLDKAEKLADSVGLFIENDKTGKIIEVEKEVLLGTIFRRKAKYDLAIQHFLKAEEIVVKTDNLKAHYTTLSQLGVCNVSLKNYERAKEYHNKAIEIAKKLDNKRYIAISYGNIGIIHRELEENLQANTMFETALQYALASTDSFAISFAYSEAGNIKIDLKEFKKARQYLMKALEIKQRLNDQTTIPYIYFYLGDLEVNEKNVVAGREWITKALVLATKMGNNKQILDSYNAYHYLYMKAGMFDSALVNYKKYKELDGKASSDAVKTKIEELNIKYESQQKDIKIKQQKLNNSYYLTGIAGLLTLLILAFGMYKRRQLKLKIQMQKAILEEQLKATNAIVKAEETERQRISRDLHDNMGAYTSALIANVQQLKATIGENEQTQKMQSNAESILNSLRETIWVLNNKEIRLEEFNDGFKNYCFKVLRNFEHINFNATESITANPLLKASVAIHLNKIMQELIQNCIKHSDATEINYSISDTNGLEIVLADNGKGFDLKQQSDGFGLDNINWRAKEAGLQLSIHSALQNGTTVQINTPK
jgi:signal transduction histidine kinase